MLGPDFLVVGRERAEQSKMSWSFWPCVLIELLDMEIGVIIVSDITEKSFSVSKYKVF